MIGIVSKRQTYAIIGVCMEVHKTLGKGYSEMVYGDALEYEFRRSQIPFEREKRFTIPYKDTILRHYYFSDFVVYGNIILEIKAIQQLSVSEIRQTLNYLAASKNELGLLINFGADSLQFKRVVL